MITRTKKQDVQLVKMDMNKLGINYLHRTNPWAAAWWSAALPGFGHLYLGELLKGIIFMSGEILINTRARINLAIYYTFTGNLEKANNVFNERWGLFYMAIWVYAIYDAYMHSVELNQLSELEEAQEKRHFKKFSITPFGISYLSQRPPLLSAFFSFLVGGMGQAYNFEFAKSIILLTWVLIINYYSHFNHLIDKFVSRQDIFLHQVNWQWLLYVPSIFVFCIWDSYVGAVEINKLLVEEQRYTFGKRKTLYGNDGGSFPMYLVGTFKQSINLELLTNTLKGQGMKKFEVIFLDRLNNDQRRTGDSIRQSDGISNLNGAMTGAAILMLFGTILGGAVIPGGPIAVGLSGFLIGAAMGYVLDRYVMGWIRRKLNLDSIKGSNPVDGEVMILVRIDNKDQHDLVSKVFAQKDVRFVAIMDRDDLKNLFA